MDECLKITRIEFHRYGLKPKSRMPIRGGALLRVTFSDLEKPGHADLHPWPEFGDPTLETWFAELRERESSVDPRSTVLRLALQAARDEAEAISRNQPLIGGSVVNHALSTDPMDLCVGDVIEARRGTFPAIKIKIGKHPVLDEAAALSRLVSHWGIRLRLDANERVGRDDLMRFLDALPIRIRETVEFIEDPFQFDLCAWRDFYRETGVAVALDRGGGADGGNTEGVALNSSLEEVFAEGAAQVLVHKPAWQDDSRAILARKRNIPVVVTSILGHPVGNIWAAAKAVQLFPDGVHGCMSHVAYRDDDAANVLLKSKQARGSRMVGIGVGLGLASKWFDRLKWEVLA